VTTATDLILAGTLATIWLTAGLLVETLPTVRTARELRRRAGMLYLLVGAGAAVFVAVPVVTGLVPGASSAPVAALLPAIPAVIVLTVTRRRLSQVRRGAGAFVTAPLAPLPPGLRAAAAHPLVTVPLQITGLATLVALPVAAGAAVVPDSAPAGVAMTVVGVAVIGSAVRASVRHNRLSVPAVIPRARAPRELTPVG
jgi:hypothetical protein